MTANHAEPVKLETAREDDFSEEEVDVHVADFRPRPSLPRCFQSKRPVWWLIECLDEGSLDLNPEYQREVVWPSKNMTGLINSLMENYYIPPIIFNTKDADLSNTDAGEVKRVCVDGKQRISSVHAFVKGAIPCNDYLGNKWWFCNVSAANRSSKRILSENARREFLDKTFIVCEYANVSPEQEEDLFARVQLGMQLSQAEKLRASSGPWQEFAKLFENDFSKVTSLLKDTSRATDFRMILSCFSQILEVQHPSGADGMPVLKTTYYSLPSLCRNHQALDDSTKSHLASVFNTFKELIELGPEVFTGMRFQKVKTFAPVEMVAVAVLISMYQATRNHRMLLGDIRALRIALRQAHAELRLNKDVWASVWKFLDELEQYRGTVDGSTVEVSSSRADNRGTGGDTTSGASPSSADAAARKPPSPKVPSRVNPGSTASKRLEGDRLHRESNQPRKSDLQSSRRVSTHGSPSPASPIVLDDDADNGSSPRQSTAGASPVVAAPQPAFAYPYGLGNRNVQSNPGTLNQKTVVSPTGNSTTVNGSAGPGLVQEQQNVAPRLQATITTTSAPTAPMYLRFTIGAPASASPATSQLQTLENGFQRSFQSAAKASMLNCPGAPGTAAPTAATPAVSSAGALSNPQPPLQPQNSMDTRLDALRSELQQAAAGKRTSGGRRPELELSPSPGPSSPGADPETERQSLLSAFRSNTSANTRNTGSTDQHIELEVETRNNKNCHGASNASRGGVSSGTQTLPVRAMTKRRRVDTENANPLRAPVRRRGGF